MPGRSLPKRSKRLKDLARFPGFCGRRRIKLRGRVYYFGKWVDDLRGERAIALWNDQTEELLAGKPLKPRDDALTLRELANHFLTEQ